MAAIEMPNVKYSHDNFSLFLFCTFFLLFFASYIFFQSPRCPIFISYSSSANTYIDSTRMAYTCAEGDLLCAEKYMDYCIKILLRIFV